MRLTANEVILWIKQDKNIRITSADYDTLMNADIKNSNTYFDDWKSTLSTWSRSGDTGGFTVSEKEILNSQPETPEKCIDWQYIVASGSFIEINPDTTPENERNQAGDYTIERAESVARLYKDKLLDVFLEYLEKQNEAG